MIVVGPDTNLICRYFNRNKLDYPNAETTRASRKYVRAMKPFTVSHSRNSPVSLIRTDHSVGVHSREPSFQPKLPGPATADLCVRPEAAHHCEAGLEAPLVQGEPH